MLGHWALESSGVEMGLHPLFWEEGDSLLCFDTPPRLRGLSEVEYSLGETVSRSGGFPVTAVTAPAVLGNSCIPPLSSLHGRLQIRPGSLVAAACWEGEVVSRQPSLLSLAEACLS